MHQNNLTPDEFVEQLHNEVINSGINENIFFRRFSNVKPEKEEARFFAQQYYYYIRTFPQILAGLSHRVMDEKVRLQIAKTVVSELGAGHGPAHYKMFEDVLSSADITIDGIDSSLFIQEAIDLVDGLRNIFLVQHPDVAVGGHYAIEETGLPMIKNLYDGFKQLEGVTTESLAYFYLHLFLEADHVDWIADAVKERAVDPDSQKRMAIGNREVLQLLHNFWNGVYNAIYEKGMDADKLSTAFLSNAAKTVPVGEISIS